VQHVEIVSLRRPGWGRIRPNRVFDPLCAMDTDGGRRPAGPNGSMARVQIADLTLGRPRRRGWLVWGAMAAYGERRLPGDSIASSEAIPSHQRPLLAGPIKRSAERVLPSG